MLPVNEHFLFLFYQFSALADGPTNTWVCDNDQTTYASTYAGSLLFLSVEEIWEEGYNQYYMGYGGGYFTNSGEFGADNLAVLSVCPGKPKGVVLFEKKINAELQEKKVFTFLPPPLSDNMGSEI